jgi:hypothetical protein
VPLKRGKKAANFQNKKTAGFMIYDILPFLSFRYAIVFPSSNLTCFSILLDRPILFVRHRSQRTKKPVRFMVGPGSEK